MSRPVPPAEALDSARGWLVAGVAFVAMFTTFGIAYSFGAFLASMSEEFGSGRGATSLFFGLTSLVYFSLGALSGPAVDRYGPRRLLLVGGVALGAGLIATSQTDRMSVALATYAVGVGTGVACAYVPMVAVVGSWFHRHRTLAVGVAVTGIGLGTLTVAPVAARMIAEVGWRETYLILGVVATAVLMGCAVIVSSPPSSPTSDDVGLREAVRDRGYRRLYIATLLLGIPLFVPFVHLPGYAIEGGTDPVAAAGLIGIIGAASILGRLALGPIAGWIGLLRAFQACFLAIAASFVLWMAGGGYGLLAVFSVVLGFGYGGFVALGPAVVADRFGTRSLGGLLGVLYTSAGIGTAIGAPAFGWLTDLSGSFTPAIAACLLLGVAAYAVVLSIEPGVEAHD